MARIGSRHWHRNTNRQFETLEQRQLLASDLIISEFMARNSTTIADEDGDFSDWAEIYNPGPKDIDLNGWHLTDDNSKLDKWSFPNQVLTAGNFLTVFASGKDRDTVGQPLHTNFRLSGTGEYLALAKTDDSVPGGILVASEFVDIPFPNRGQDVSYGIGQSVDVQYLVEKGDNSKLLFPTNNSLGTSWTETNFNHSTWQDAKNAIGYEQSVPGFMVQDAKSSSTISNLSQATSLLNGSNRISETTVISPIVNFHDPGGGGGVGNYGNPTLFPNDRPGNDDDFAIRATGTIHIPSAGTWTFGTNSDDGVRVRVDGQNVINDNSLHAPQNRFGQKSLSAGPHSIELVFFERGGGAEVELFAAKGSYSLFNASAFRLVGDVANGGLVVETLPGTQSVSTGFSGVIETDTLSAMYDSLAGAYQRIPFVAFETGDLNSLTLRMRYDDAYVAYLNGTEVARRNAPANAQYSSTALTDRHDEAGLLIEDVDISQHLGLLNNGLNVLAVHAMNDAIDSDEFLAIAELAEVTVNDSAEVYFTAPTPGAFNSDTGVEGFLIDEIQFSHPHGFYDDSFSLTLDTRTVGTTVRYTTDGTEPTASHGTVYSSPINISQTSAIRARAFKNGLDPSNVATATYLFVDDIIRQSPTGSAPSGFPTSRSINGQTLDYGMDPAIVNSGTWGPQLEEALKQVPSMSIVMDIDDLLSSRSGIYTHAGNHGKAWERPISLELINPDGGADFTSNAGLRIRGGFSRSGGNPKHAFRVFFRDEYGNGKLDFPLFEDEGVSSFDKFDLRTTQNYSWSFQGSSRNAFVRDVFSRDLQGLMGHEYTRSRFYHLYINGQYWGLFQTQERSEARFAASYMGGNPADYDVVKSAGSSGGYQNEATDGNLAAYQRLANFFYQSGGLGDSKMNDYWKAQGMNPDGTRNPNFERLLDVDNVMDYMILTYYTSDADGPGSKFTRPRVNNYFGIFNRENPDGFKFFEHDSEHSLDTGNAAGANYNMVTPLTTGGSQFRYFNPHWMHERLANTNSEYRQRFADRVNELFYNDGLLTPENAKAIIDARAAEFDMAIIAESARWGDAKRGTPFTKNDWRNAVNSVKSFIDNRIPTVLNQIKGQGWYPGTNPPQFTVNGNPQSSGEIETDDLIGMFGTSSTSFSTLVNDGSTWRYLDNGSNQGTAWRGTSFNDNSWKSGRAELGYGDGGERTTVGFGPNSGNKYRTTYFRHTFNVADTSAYQQLRVRLRRDDGAIVYLNGQEIVRSNMPSGTVDYNDFAAGVVGGGEESTYFDFDVDKSALNNGSNVLAVEVHQANAGSSDISFDLELLGAQFNNASGNLRYTLDGSDPRMLGGGVNPNSTLYDGNPFTLDTTAVIKARIFDNNEWSALSTATYLVDVPAAVGNLAITEINYNPHDALIQFDELDVDNDQFEYVTLQNIGPDRIDLTGVQLVNAINVDENEGIEFEFATQTLDPGEEIVVVRNRAAFASRYGTGVRIAEANHQAAGSGVFGGALNNGGEQLTLVDRKGEIIQQFEYNDGGSWPGRADGNASSLEVVDTNGDYNSPANWRNSNEFGGSPGSKGTGPFDNVIINEVLTHTDLPQIDAIELLNVTGSPQPIGGWYISDNNSDYFKYHFSILEKPIPAGEYRVIDENELGFGFKGQESDDAWLIQADLVGRPLRFADHVEFSAAQNGVSFGRWPNGEGRIFPMQSLTLDAQNSGPVVSDVVIGEVHYNPADPGAGFVLTASELEFVELWNDSQQPVNIENWRLNKAIDYEFSNNTILPANGRLTVVRFDPTAESEKASAFRTAFGMSPVATLLGPYSGQLDNGGENLELDRPEDIAQLGLGYVLVDRVQYDEVAPWPSGADGQGSSLNRESGAQFGNFVASWQAASPSPGSAPNNTNNQPVGNDDVYSVNEGDTLNMAASGVLLNDTDSDGDSLSAFLLVGSNHGSLDLRSDGSFEYVHDGSESTSDSFSYSVSDGNGGFDNASVQITIHPVNDIPIANGDSYGVNEGGTLTIDAPGVLINDTDAENDSLIATVLTQPNSGVLTLQSDGSFTYVHNGNEATQDSFNYEIEDGNGGAASAIVSISINRVNDVPIAEDDSYSVNQGAALVIAAPGVLANDSDADEDNLTTTVRIEPLHGTLSLQADGSFTYTHDGSDTIFDSFTYDANDGNGGTTSGSVSITIIPSDGNPGDFNEDGVVDVLDVDLHCGQIKNGANDLKYDLDGNNIVDQDDFSFLITNILNTTVGDANLDGRFNSKDLILIFQAGKYEDGVVNNSTWAEGDWDCNGDFDTGDLITAFQAGSYEIAARIGENVAAAIAGDASLDRHDTVEKHPHKTNTAPVFKTNMLVDPVIRDLIFAGDFDVERRQDDEKSLHESME